MASGCVIDSGVKKRVPCLDHLEHFVWIDPLLKIDLRGLLRENFLNF